MRFEEFESRIVLDQSLGPALDVDIDTDTVEQTPTPTAPELPTDIQFRSTGDDFVYSSDELDPALVDQLAATSETWANSPATARELNFSDTEVWKKTVNTYPPTIHPDGYIVAERVANYNDKHALLVVKKRDSDGFASGGSYTKQDYHYRISFDVRHPTSELSWLTDHTWAIVTQMWGPREGGESARNPPFAIYTKSVNGVPTWTIRSLGDSRRITQSGEFEDEHVQEIPMENIGDWNHFDIEFVPNPFGKGLIRTWLNGELVAEWIDIQSNYFSKFGDLAVGPFNPSFGLYAPLAEPGMEAHFDNVVVESSGRFQSSISGRVTGTTELEGNTVFATNSVTGQRYGTRTGSSGVYTLAVPKGQYTLTAVNQDTGRQVTVENVQTTASSQLVDINVVGSPPSTAPPPPPLLTLTGDVTGDGRADVINRLADGSWQVTVIETEVGGVSASARQPRDPDPPPTDPSPTDPPPQPEPTEPQTRASETSIWTTWSTNTTWTDIQIADFTGDGLQDIAGRASDGGWWVAESTGTGFRNKLWGKWLPGTEWLDVSVGDFNGDGLADIAGRAATDGSWWIATSQGSEFTIGSWGRWSVGIGWEHVSVGDFNGDGLSDIVGRAATDGTWWVSQSNGQRFHNKHWGEFTTAVQWLDVQVGDFNGDGRSDIIGRAAGSWWVAQSTGTRFQNSYFGRWNASISWLDVSVADVDGDGKSDLVARAHQDGSWWVARSTGTHFEARSWGAIWETDTDWIASAIDDFDGDGTVDLLGGTDDKWSLFL